MSFYYPLGLLGLIGVPIIILIYIIKSKYTEQTVASTYLWELSEKFLKRKKPISKLTGIITLILQLLAVILASLLIAHPVFTVRNSANDIYFILDGSASMNVRDDGVTRFEKAQAEINDIIDGSLGGSSYTLVFVGESTDVLFEGVTDKTQAKTSVSELDAGWCAADCSSALVAAQGFFDANRSAVIYLVTDKNYQTENMTLVDVSNDEYNCAIVDCAQKTVGGGIVGTGKVISYSRDTMLTVAMSVKDAADAEPVTVATVDIDCKAGEFVEFELEAEVTDFFSVRLEILQSDAFAEDNFVELYSLSQAKDRTVLFVDNTDDGRYLMNAIATSGSSTVTRVTPKVYNETDYSDAGYRVYVFNGYTPKVLPTNAAIWLVDAIDGGGTGSGIGFSQYMIPRDTTGPDSYYNAEYAQSGNSHTLFNLLTDGLVERDVAIRRYAKYNMRGFETILSVGGDPVIAAGLNEKNDRQVVFAFEIGDSNLGLLDDFLILVRNLMNYSLPSVLNENKFVCGETMSVNVVSGCESIVLTSPSGDATTLDTLDNDICEVTLNEMGTYKLTVKLTGAGEENYYAYATVPESESRGGEGARLALSGEREYDYSDGYYDKLLAFFIVIAVALLADWGIYCYEQHQLR